MIWITSVVLGLLLCEKSPFSDVQSHSTVQNGEYSNFKPLCSFFFNFKPSVVAWFLVIFFWFIVGQISDVHGRDQERCGLQHLSSPWATMPNSSNSNTNSDGEGSETGWVVSVYERNRLSPCLFVCLFSISTVQVGNHHLGLIRHRSLTAFLVNIVILVTWLRQNDEPLSFFTCRLKEIFL